MIKQCFTTRSTNTPRDTQWNEHLVCERKNNNENVRIRATRCSPNNGLLKTEIGWLRMRCFGLKEQANALYDNKIRNQANRWWKIVYIAAKWQRQCVNVCVRHTPVWVLACMRAYVHVYLYGRTTKGNMEVSKRERMRRIMRQPGTLKERRE